MFILVDSLVRGTFLSFVAFTSIVAQGIPGGIHGRVADSASLAPLGNATIAVSLPGKPGPLFRVTSSADGAFRVTSVSAGQYQVVVQRIGFKPWTRRVVTVASSSVDIGTVLLQSSPLELQSLAVTGKRADVQLAPDRNSYVVRDMPAAKGGSALDVLRSVPAVDVDIDNVVSLRGNSGVTIQVNGRPSPLKAAQLGDYLAQLPADMVDKIEIIPNPSARDDPTGVAGIINILLKEEVDAGTNGSATIAAATTSQANAGVTLGYEHKAVSLFGSYGFLRDRRPRSESIFRENNYTLPLTFLDEASTRTQSRQIHTVTGSVGYRLSAHSDLSLDLVASTRGDRESSDLLYRALNASRGLTGLSDRSSTGTNRENDADAALTLKRAFAQKGHKLSVEARAVYHSEGGPSDVAAHALSPSGIILATTDQELLQNLERPQQRSLKVDYARPLTARLRFESGYKGTVDRFHTGLDTRVFDPGTGAFVIDASRTSDFQYHQLVNAGYGVFTGQLAKLQFQGGLRVEHASTEFRVASVSTAFNNSYNNVFPSGLVSFSVNEVTQLKASYSARIRRPDDADQLDPIVHYADPLNLSRGNPYLQPEHTSAYELGFQRAYGKTTFQVTPFFRRTFDAVRTLRTIDSAGVTTRTFANIATSDASGGDVTLAFSGRRLNGSLGGSAFHQSTNASNVAPDLSIRTSGWRARTNIGYRASGSVDLQALLTYQSAVTVEQGTNSSRTQFNLAARQKFMDDQLSVTLRVIDPFNTSHESGTTTDPRFVQTSYRYRAIRGLLLSATWTFGKPEKESDRIDLSGDGTPL